MFFHSLLEYIFHFPCSDGTRLSQKQLKPLNRHSGFWLKSPRDKGVEFRHKTHCGIRIWWCWKIDVLLLFPRSFFSQMATYMVFPNLTVLGELDFTINPHRFLRSGRAFLGYTLVWKPREWLGPRIYWPDELSKTYFTQYYSFMETQGYHPPTLLSPLQYGLTKALLRDHGAYSNLSPPACGLLPHQCQAYPHGSWWHCFTPSDSSPTSQVGTLKLRWVNYLVVEPTLFNADHLPRVSGQKKMKPPPIWRCFEKSNKDLLPNGGEIRWCDIPW